MKVVIAEKPSVARDIAKHLGASQSRSGYLEGNGYAVTWAFGHLVELKEPEGYKPEWKSWKLSSLPMIPEKFELASRDERSSQEQLDTISSLFKKAKEIICATDAGREGELIFRYILSWSNCENKPIKRLWISSLTKKAIANGFSNLAEGSAYDNLYYAAKSRSEADWIVGINATRFFTVEYGKRNLLLSVGRVQTPILAMIVQRDKDIESFDSKNFWEVHTKVKESLFRHTKGKFDSQKNASAIVSKIDGKELIIEAIEKKDEKSNPPLLLDLTELQRELNTRHGLTADETLRIAQNLYENKHITYPRTDSRYLTNDLQPTIAPLLKKFLPFREKEIGKLELDNLKFSKRIVNDSRVSDHHAIIPTDSLPKKLNDQEKKVYNAILTRLIAVFYPPCIKSVTTVEASCEKEPFKARGTQIRDPGWQALYPASEKQRKKAAKKSGNQASAEQPIPDFQTGEQYLHKPRVETFKTSPPKRFTEASLLQLMETAGKKIEDEELKDALKDQGIGTPATRASIIETLIQRDFIERRRKSLVSASKGRQLIAIVQDERLKSPELTGEWEYRLKKMERGEYDPQQFRKEVEAYIREILSATSEKTIDLKNLGPCPICEASVIRGKTGYGCSQWRQGCSFAIREDSLGANISPTLMRELLLNRQSLSSVGISHEGNRALAKLKLTKEGKLEYTIFDSNNPDSNDPSIGLCPVCGGPVNERKGSYSCGNWRQGCRFAIWKVIAKKEIDRDTAICLLKDKTTAVIDGFKSKSGKDFSARLEIRNGEVKFLFE